MAGTAPACKEVLSSCIPVYDPILITFSYKELAKIKKKLISCTHFPTLWEILWKETNKYDTSLSVLENEDCSRPSGTHV